MAASTQPAEITKAWWYVLSFIAGGGVGWFLSQLKTISEISKLRSERQKLDRESVAKAAEFLTKVHEAREAFDKACRSCDQRIIRLTECIAKGSPAQDVVDARNRLCHTFAHRIIPSFLKVVEFEELRWTSDPAQLHEFFNHSVVAELRQWANWLKVFNAPALLNKYELAPYKCHKGTLMPFYDSAARFKSPSRDTTSRMVADAIDKIMQASGN